MVSVQLPEVKPIRDRQQPQGEQLQNLGQGASFPGSRQHLVLDTSCFLFCVRFLTRSLGRSLPSVDIVSARSYWCARTSCLVLELWGQDSDSLSRREGACMEDFHSGHLHPFAQGRECSNMGLSASFFSPRTFALAPVGKSPLQQLSDRHPASLALTKVQSSLERGSV